MLFEVELIINNASLTYVYSNTIETCLTLNHFLIGRQLLYSSKTKSTAITNQTTHSSTADKINRISNHFWDSSRYEYICSQFTWDTANIKIKYEFPKINVNNIVLVYNEKVPRHFWRTAIVTGILPSRDSKIRGAITRIAKTIIILKRPVNKLFVTKIHIKTLTKQIR